MGILILTAVAFIILFVNNHQETIIERLSKKYEIINNIVPNKILVNDKKTAEKIAEAVLQPIYGDSINDKEPFDIKFDKEYDAWVVKGTLKANEIGGVPGVIIRKKDGKIIAVWHTK